MVLFLHLDQFKCHGKRLVKIILTSAANFSWKTLPILIITYFIGFSSLQFKLLVPQWTATYLTDGGKDKTSALHKTSHGFCLQKCNNSVACLNYFFHTAWYLLSSTTSESPINNTEGCNTFANMSWLLCGLYQLTLLLHSVGVASKSYDWL